MGKTLGNIIAVGFAIGINFVPGVGQFVSGAIVGALGGTFTAVGIASAVVSTLQLGSLAVGLQSGASLLGLGPSLPKPDTSVTAIKTSRPPRVSAYGIGRLYFAYALYETATNGTAVDVGAVHDGKMAELVGFYLNDDTVTLTGNTVNAGADKRYQDGAVSLYWTDGSNPGTVFGAVSALIPDWDANHRGDGVVMLAQLSKAVKSKRYLETYPNQIPTPSMVAKWQLCPDPYATDPSDPAGWTWTENPVRQLMHYKLLREGVDYATKIAPTIAYWRAAADVCNEARPLKAGGTEPRYRSWLTHKHTDRHDSVQAALLSTFDGWIAPRADGALVVYAGEYYEPTETIGPADIIAYDWNGVGVDDDKAVNEIVCSYISADHDYSTVETDAWRDEDDIAERGQILSGNLDPQVPSWGQCRALAKIKMARTNAIHSGTITTNVAGRRIRGQRFIHLLIEDAGTVFLDAPVEITSLTRNLVTGGVTFSWVLVDPNMYEWNAATEEGNPAAKGDRVAPAPLTTPTITDAEAELGDGGSTARIRITVDGFDREDVTWFARWRVTTDTTWNEQTYTDIDPGPAAQLLTSVVPINVGIDVEVAYGVGDGRISDWSAMETVSTSTAGLAPAPVSDTAVTSPAAGQASIAWRDPTSSNYSATRLFRNSTNNFNTATQVNGDFLGTLGATQVYDDTGQPSGSTRHYWLVTVSAAGVAGTPTYAGSVVIS